ncbi:hypothetical protein COU54_03775 [Candidatus Pacearchaeota archaeon CG10_big_fil_rev_8_21_14_0_10_31_24]|nr:MAG: hypothetical protein COU54_03775 [Candidatus Pacearchaeota archaeon CG10_big_fil_rev_8_21_14_0_10_31_24]
MSPGDILQQYINFTDSFLMMRLLFFLLIFIVIHEILKRTPLIGTNKLNSLIISLLIAAMSSLYMKEESIANFIIVPYTTLGVILLFTLPMFLILLFIHKTALTENGRKVIWGIYALCIGYIWYSFNANGYYIDNDVFMIIAILIFILIVADKQINKLFKKKD